MLTPYCSVYYTILPVLFHTARDQPTTYAATHTMPLLWKSKKLREHLL